MEQLRALFTQKKDIAEEYVQMRFAMSYDDFIKFGKQNLPPDTFHDAVLKISALTLRADFIIAGFIDGSTEIYSTDENGKARIASSYAVVGEGEYIASSVLLRRGQSDDETLERTIYNVFEAKRYSESIGSVGKKTVLSVIRPDGTDFILSFGLDVQLDALYKKYGPTTLPKEIVFKGNYFYDAETNEEKP